MNASEAVAVAFTQLIKDIEHAANDGRFSMSSTRRIPHGIKIKLEKLGYRVTVETSGSLFNTYDYTRISWNE